MGVIAQHWVRRQGRTTRTLRVSCVYTNTVAQQLYSNFKFWSTRRFSIFFFLNVQIVFYHRGFINILIWISNGLLIYEEMILYFSLQINKMSLPRRADDTSLSFVRTALYWAITRLNNAFAAKGRWSVRYFSTYFWTLVRCFSVVKLVMLGLWTRWPAKEKQWRWKADIFLWPLSVCRDQTRLPVSNY